MNAQTTFTVAAAQAAPVYLDRQATLEKAVGFITEAAKNGARLIVFPEAFIPAYPDWVWSVPGGNKHLLDSLYQELVDNAVAVPDETTQALCKAARKAKIHIAMGINERNRKASNASLYNSLLYIDDAGEILGVHRKLIPTAAERTVWAPGDGSTMHVFDTSIGRLGGLICWENYMPLARQAMYNHGTQIYVAPTWDYGDQWIASLRHIAKEGGMYVIGCCIPLHIDDIPDRLEFKQLYPKGTEWINAGTSCVVAPSGKVIAGPLHEKEELLYAEIDLGRATAAKRMLDVAGHYARPDVFKFSVNQDPNSMLTSDGSQ
ncbi:MAG: carbon-nitrogen hydrolase family protein [Anaerolineales bacterium]|jgi:nitrilase